MKITQIDVTHLNIPLKKPYMLSKTIGIVNSSQPIIVKIFTDEGLFGIGETDPLPPFTEESPDTVKTIIKKCIGPVILGTNPLNIANIHRMMDSVIKGNSLAKAAIDIACYDILGKFSNLSVSSLLGGNLQTQIPIMWSIGSDLPNINVEEAIKIKKQGYKSIMIKVGALSIYDDIERIEAVRNAVGNEYPLIVDANQAWNTSTAIRFVKLAEKYSISLLEQPVPYWDIDGMVRVRASTDIPISADESLFTIHNAKELIKKKAADVFSIKVAKHGGIYKSKKIIDLAKAYGISCMMNSMIEEGITQAASLQLGSSSDNLIESGHAYFSPLRLKDDISDYSSFIKNGSVFLNNAPGLGIKIIEEILTKYTVERITIT